MNAQTEQQLTPQQATEVERLKKIRAKVLKLSAEFDEDIKRNKKQGNRTVYNYHGSWVVRPHIYTPSKEDLSID